MDINKLLDDPQGCLDYMERYINDGSPSGFTFINNTSLETNPLSDKQSFNLYRVYFPYEWGIKIGNFPECLNDSSEKNMDSMLIHPDCVSHLTEYKLQETDIRVIPTSSSRTVRMVDYDYYLKLNYFGILGRIKRNLTNRHALASYEISEILNQLLTSKKYDKLCFLPESSAKLMFNSCKNIDAGIVVRDCKQVGRRAEMIKCKMPAFSLFSKDRKSPEDKPLLIQLIKMHGVDPVEYILQEIIYPIIKYYFNLIVDEGFESEWHAQNLLLGFDSRMKIQSFIMRDLESIDIDEEMRHKAGKKERLSSYRYKHLSKDQYNYRIKHSFMYDFKLCKYLIEPIIVCVCEEYNLDKSKVIEKVRSYADKKIETLPSDFFPEDWYSFDHVLIDQSRDERPYINNGHPIYRSR